MNHELQPRDLRIGNLVNYRFWNPHPKTPDYEFTEAVVVRVNINNVNFQLNGGTILKQMVSYGIPLTEYYLLKMGFEKYTETSFAIEIHNGWKIIWEANGYIYLKYLETECEVSHKEYKYVHELQNLYHSLTGQELLQSA